MASRGALYNKLAMQGDRAPLLRTPTYANRGMQGADQRQFDPQELIGDDGTSLRVDDRNPVGMQQFGERQIEERRRQLRETEDPSGLLRGGRLLGGPLPDKAWDAYFGVLQGKENAAQAAGKRLQFDERAWGNPKVQDYSPAGRGMGYSPAAEDEPPSWAQSENRNKLWAQAQNALQFSLRR